MRPRTVILDPIDRHLLVLGAPGVLVDGVTTTAAADQALLVLGATLGKWDPVGEHWPEAQQADVTFP